MCHQEDNQGVWALWYTACSHLSEVVVSTAFSGSRVLLKVFNSIGLCRKYISMKNLFKKLVFFLLLALFLYAINNAARKLMDRKIGVTVSRGYSDYRLFPSISICFVMKGVNRDDAFPHIDDTLNHTRYEVLINLRDKVRFLHER